MCNDFAHALLLVGEKNRIANLSRDSCGTATRIMRCFGGFDSGRGLQFLAWVAAFVKTYRIDQVKIQSLWDKPLTGCVGDSRISSANFQ
ncbi:MAG: hypothetical protein CM1200mP41_17740 [Gammaproteobacteria bacterium]|nr:MAG: hypothetical protein CM1200mP41_17740 [Gammaproteobacteria bacterium]